MPDGLLLFAFALTLVANAVLIVVAIRAMRSSPANEDAERGGARDHERSMSGGPVESPVGPSSRDRVAAPAPLPTPKVDRVPVRPLPLAPPPPSVRPVAMATAGALVAMATAGAPVAVDPVAAEEPVAPEGSAGIPTPAPSTRAEPADPAPRRAKRARSTAAAGHDVSVDSAPASAPDAPAATDPSPAPEAPATARRTVTPRSGASRRRRFSLPPLDDDHEKVNRSIESFLSSGEPADDPSARRAGEAIAGSARAADRAARDATKGRAADGGRPPTTVALVAVAAARPDASASDSAPDAPPAGAIPPDSSPRADAAVAGASEGETAAIAAVERSLRAAARGTDHVESVAHGRFRVVLAATGELAARAYLRRVRATVEPLLEELDPPRRLAVATATILGEPIDRAYEMVERRLDAVVNRARGDDDPARPGDDAASASIGPRPAPRASGDD